jgi:hypothetical protein
LENLTNKYKAKTAPNFLSNSKDSLLIVSWVTMKTIQMNR